MKIMPSNKDVVQELQDILRNWEESQSGVTYDPTNNLVKLCELFEREIINFLKQDPDPFDDRHPITSKPDCALGQILRALFKKDAFVNKLVNHYLKDNYFSTLICNKSSVDLNVAACRLLLDLLHGLDVPQVFRDADMTVLKLYSWALKPNEPLATYATGLLAAAMDIPDLATSFRDQNSTLVPIILKRLRDLKDQEDDHFENDENKIPNRPFAHLNSDFHESQTEQNEESIKQEIESISKRLNSDLHNKGIVDSPNKRKRQSSEVNHQLSTSAPVSPKSFICSDTNASLPSGMLSPTMMNSDCSNSSWAELSSNIVGTFKMYPLEKATKEMFMLKYLRPVGEYQESLGHVYEHRALDLVFHYMNVRVTGHARLSFEALRFLGSLLFHKKFCIEFVNMEGVQKLIQVPRPSLPADGVSLCLWYLAYCEEAIERTCLLPEHVVTELVRYALWLLECSHQSSRMHAVMFFGMVFRFRAILEKFDEQDGLRKMLNILATLSIFQDSSWDQLDRVEEPNEVMMWQIVKQVCLSIKCYYEAHIIIKASQLQRTVNSSLSSSSSCSSLSSLQHSTPAYKSLNITTDIVEKNVEYLLEHLPFKSRWKPVDQFLSLGAVPLMLKLVVTILNETFSSNRTDIAVYALDILYSCSVLPSVQLSLCDKIDLPPNEDILSEFSQEASGYAILVSCIHESRQSVTSSSEIQRAALNVLINCLCAPIHRSGSGNISPLKNASIQQSSSTNKKKCPLTSEDIINKSWDCVRNSNGIMDLLNLLHKKVPITDADGIRCQACRALVGLSRSDNGRQIMSKLPIFSSGQLQLLMREPILQDKRIEHVKFQKHALDLIKAVSGREKTQEKNSGTDVSIQSIHKANVVAQTKISYNKQQLLQLICNYLVKQNFENVATELQKEADLPPLNVSMGPPRASIGSPVTPAGRVLNKKSLFKSNNLQLGGAKMCQRNSLNEITATTSNPNQFVVNRPSSSRKANLTPNNSLTFSKMENLNSPILHPNSPSLYASQTMNEPATTLDRIVVEYLTNQHALCENPVVTCPTFDLFQPHRCPTSKNVKTSPANFTMRYTKHLYTNSRGATFKDLNRKRIYSRYRPSHVFKATEDDEVFLTCEFTPDDQNILVGTTRGEVKLCNKYSDAVIAQETVHNNYVTSIVPHKLGDLVLTSCSSAHEAALWNISDNIFDNKFTFNDCQHAEFSTSYDRILSTMDHTARIYDLNTCNIISEFTPTMSNHYKVNKATLDPTDELLLTDGVLYDIRSGEQIHKFDKINPLLNGIFHRNGLEIISSSEIWDLRTFHLLRTVPILSLCDVSFNHCGDVIFGIMVGDEDLEENAYETSFKTIDSADYSSIATVDVRRIVSSLSINQLDTQIAVVETDGPSDMENAVVRIYDIGMTRQEEDEALDDDEDDEIASDDSDDDDSDDDANDTSDGDASQNDLEQGSNQSDEAASDPNDANSSSIDEEAASEADADEVDSEADLAVEDLLDSLEADMLEVLDGFEEEETTRPRRSTRSTRNRFRGFPNNENNR